MSLLTTLMYTASSDSSLPLAGLLMLNQQREHPPSGRTWSPPDIQPKQPDLPLFDPNSIPDTKPVSLNTTDVDNAFRRFHETNTDSRANSNIIDFLASAIICMMFF